MFAGLNDFIGQILGLFQWWIVVAPFESVIRIRFGKKITVLEPGIHLRIPSLDRFFVQRTRKRYMNTPTQTATTKDKQAVTVSGGTSYSIDNIELLYNTLSDPEDVIQIETLALVCSYIANKNLEEVNPINIQEYVTKNLHLERYGLSGVKFLVTDFVCVKTYRIINSNPKESSWDSNKLTTSTEKNPK